MFGRRSIKRQLQAFLLVLVIASACLLPAGCAKAPVVGSINDQATVALIQFEAQEDGINGVVYRQINRFNAFLGQSDVPVLVVFYSALAPVNSMIIPCLEQMADDYQDQLQIVWIDANAESALSASFNVEKLPQFTVVVDGALKRSLIGFDDEGIVHLESLLDPYLVSP